MKLKLVSSIILISLLTLPTTAQIRQTSSSRLTPPTREEGIQMFEIFPQSVTLFPGDTQKLTFRATPPPIIWDATTNCTITSAGSLVRASSGTFGATITQRVHSGIAAVEWTFSSDMLPTGSGYLEFWLFGVGTIAPTHAFRVKVETGTTTVTDENPTTLDTITHSVASGDVYKLEIAGQMFRLYINGTLETEHDIGSTTEYPYRANAYGYGTMASATPMIVAPNLTGNWDIFPSDSAHENLWTPTGGTLDASVDVWQPTFTAGDQPGVFTQTCTVEDSRPSAVTYQTATSIIIIPPLSVLSETSVTLQPGAKATFRTNYDSAQTRLVTWSVVSGGGSFSNGEYTAPTAPGSPIVKATSGDQFVIIRITVPAVMTIETSGGEDVTAATLGEVLTLTTNMTGTINWTASVGSLSSSTGSTVTWTAPNQSQIVGLITATNGTYTVTVEIPVLKAFPYRPNRPLKWERRKTVLISRSEDRRRAARVKDANNQAFEPFELAFQDRSLAELDAATAFWDEHHPDKRFIFTDQHRGVRKVVYFDSDVSFDANATCATTYSFRVIEG